MANPNPNTSGLRRPKKGDPAPKGVGRPKGAFSKKTIVTRVLDAPLDTLLHPNDYPKWLREQKPKTIFEAITMRQALEALKGDTKAYSALSKALGEDFNVSVQQAPKPILAGMSNEAKELNARISSNDSDNETQPIDQKD